MAYSQSDCDSCGKCCESNPADTAAHQQWARRHVRSNPTHTVFVATERTRVYRGLEAT